MGISVRGTKAKSITSCDNAFVTNIVLARDLAAKRSGRGTKAKSITSCDNAFVTNILLPRRPQEALLCAKAMLQQQQMFSVAKAKRQLQMFYLCESEATATKRPAGTEINHTLWK
ncbi:hypothetical protein ACQKMI_15285 [Lysinibacillus sp. NPDC097214]|uniref:hypothetical protein n=1 Tax=Lysinibacillus sp. NPDC097214 TaxID=3390584 RepID=UPI003CFFB1EC